MSKRGAMINLQTSDNIDETYRLLGELAPEIAYIACPETFKLHNMAHFYDDLLPEEPTDIIIWIDGIKEVVTIQKGDIVNSKLFMTVISRSFWEEMNHTLRIVDPPKDIALAAATTGSLEKTGAKKRKQEEVRMLEFFKGMGVSMEEFDHFIKTGEYLEEEEEELKDKVEEKTHEEELQEIMDKEENDD